MTQQIDMDEARLRLESLLDAVERGEEIVLARTGRPVATLTAYVPPPPKRELLPPGFFGNPGWDIPDDVFDPMELVYSRDICRDPTHCEKSVHLPPDELFVESLVDGASHSGENE